jgi:hypothetical protein
VPMSDLEQSRCPWLLLIHQLPTQPAYFRVKIWRRLQGIGAVAVKSTVYALPAKPETQEDFAWLLKEIVEGGGEAMICEARLIDGLSDSQVRALFDAARDQDYEALAKEGRALAASLSAEEGPQKRAEVRTQLGRLRKRFAEIISIDFFGANGREAVEGLLGGIEKQLAEAETMNETPSPQGGRDVPGLKGLIWVTREGVHVDRIACAWLIRRFIDQEAVIRFVAGKGYVPNPGEVRFDMFEGEFTHEGDQCSFEVLLSRAGLEEPALQVIAEIVHDIDLKDGKFGREETTGIAHLIAGIAMAARDDEQRIARGSAVFDDLFEYHQRKRK